MLYSAFNKIQNNASGEVKVQNKFKHKCYVCNNEIDKFNPFSLTSKSFSEYITRLQMVDSDFINFECRHCGSIDRERHLFMYFDKLNLWEIIENGKVLHFAPKINLRKAIIEKQKNTLNAEYILANLHANGDGEVRQIDATNMPFPDDDFVFIMFNHMLEHIINYEKALSEIYRILKKEGIAILQTPYSQLLKHNIEDSNIISKEDRRIFYGQDDHVRVFSKNDLFDTIKRAGFKLEIISSSFICNEEESRYYGVNPIEDLIMAVK
jgi:hypothetical protein